MNTTLSSIAIDVVGQYGEAAKHLVNAYQSGAERTFAGIGNRFEQLLESRALPLVSGESKAAIISAEKRLAGKMVKAFARAGERTSSAIDQVSNGAVTSVETLANRTAWASDLFVVNALRTINLPPAQLSLNIAGKINKATRRLSERVAPVADEQAVETVDTPAARAPAKRRRAAAKA